MTKQAKKLIINVAVLVVLIGVTMLVLLLNYKELNFKNIGLFLKESRGWCIAAAFVCMLISVIAEGGALWLISRRLGHKTKAHQAFAYASADIYYSAITPSSSGGQPASLFYMVRDGMDGGMAGFTLVFNTLAYSAAIVMIGIFVLIAGPATFGQIDGHFSRVLIILGFIFQALLVLLVLTCMLFSRLPRKLGNAFIKLGKKLHVIKNQQKWHDKWNGVIDKYRHCRAELRKHWMLILPVLLLSLLQRAALMLIPCFICHAAAPEMPLCDLFILQAYVVLGYNSLPLPGGVGAFEYLYLHVYNAHFNEAFILSAMMVSRVISFYFRTILCGLYTLVYHAVGLRKSKEAPIDPDAEALLSLEGGEEPPTETGSEEANEGAQVQIVQEEQSEEENGMHVDEQYGEVISEARTVNGSE